MFKSTLPFLLSLLLLSLPAHADQEADCKVAYARGDWAGYHNDKCQFLEDQITARMQADSRPGIIAEGTGRPTPQDYRDAMNILQPLAEHGDTDAQMKLGEVLFQACHQSYTPSAKPPCDYDALIKWSKAAAEKGNAEAAYTVGMAYSWAVKPDQETQAKALTWLNQAADLGYERAKEMLRGIYSDNAYADNKAGNLVATEADWAEAYFWDSVSKIGHNNPSHLQEFRVHLTAEEASEQDKRADKWLAAHPITP